MANLDVKRIKKIIYTGWNLEEGLEMVCKKLQEEPNNSEYRFYYAELLSKSASEEDNLKAISIYKELSQELNRDYNFKIASVYLKIGNEEKAVKRFKRIQNRNNYAKFELVKIYIKNGNYDDALILLEQIEKKIDIYDEKCFSRVITQQKKVYRNLDRIEEFKEKLLKYTELDDCPYIIYEQLAEVYYYSKDFSKAKELYLKIENIDNLYLKFNHLGEIYFHEKEYEKAIECYKKSVEYNTNGDIGYIYIKIGNCYTELGLLEEAKNYYILANEIAPTKQSYLKLGKIELLLHQQDTENVTEFKHLYLAKEKFKDGVEKYPDDIFLKYELAKVQITLCKYRSAMRYLDEILAIKKDRFSLIEKAKIYQFERKYLSAIEIYEDLLNEEEDIQLRLEYGRCFYCLEEFERAILEFDKILEMTNGKDDFAIIEKSRALKKMGEKNKATNILDSISGENVFIDIEKANNLFEEGQNVEAIKLLEESIKKHPDSARLLHAKARIEKEHGFFYLAIDDLKKAISLEKKNLFVYVLGQCYEGIEDYDNAIMEYKKLSNSTDYYIESHLALSKVYLKLGDLETAYAYAYPIVDTKRKNDALARMFKIESLIGCKHVYDRYYDELNEVSKEHIKKVMRNL